MADQDRWTDEAVERIKLVADDETVTVRERIDNLNTIEVALDAARDHVSDRLDEGAE